MKNQKKKVNVKENYNKTDFDYKFLKMENNNKNMIYSPLSIKYALKMLSDGSEGTTKKEIDNVLKEETITKYNNIDKVLSLANAAFIRDNYAKYVKEEYINTLTNNYNAFVKYDAFKDAKNINKWIENKTLGQIKNMLDDDKIKQLENEIVLVNALALNMKWKEKFDEDDTFKDEFYIDKDKKMDVAMMNKEFSSDSLSYYIDDKINAVSIALKKYKDIEMEYLLIMPNDDLKSYVDDFSSNKLNDITNNLSNASSIKNGVKVYIPKYSYEYDLNLKDDLNMLGMNDAFGDNANFSNMSKRALKVGDMLHKAKIDLTEKGVKASGVTVIFMEEGAMLKEKPLSISFNKPFMYLIRDKKTKDVWFVGTVYEPNSWQDEHENYKYK